MKHKLKQKQNQRITRITEKTLVVGADIAKKVHVGASPNGAPVTALSKYRIRIIHSIRPKVF